MKNSISNIMKNLKAEDIMSTKIRTLTSDDTVEKAIKMMGENSISAIVIEDSGKVHGIFTERDVIKKVLLNKKDPKKTRLRQVMTKTPVIVSPGISILKASSIMKQKKVRKLLVLKDGKMAGLLSQTDVIASMNEIFLSYKTLLWNPWFSIVMFLIITALFILNYVIFRV